MSSELCVILLGAGGFVGSHLRAELESRFGGAARVVATTRTPGDALTEALDLSDTEALRAVIRRERPTHMVNLVGIAAPVEARNHPALAWEVHACAPERLGRVLMEEAPDCWLLHVSSGLIYGRSASHGGAVDESAALAPVDPYAVTKAAGDLAIGALANDGLKCLRLRPFNHIGPGQSEDFVVPAVAAQIVRIREGRQPPVLRIGNLSAVRDFLDVRDVVAAYAMLIADSHTLTPGTIFNIASGSGVRIEAVLHELIALSGIGMTVELDPARQRPSDLPVCVGDAHALSHATGWHPQRSLTQTLSDTLNSISHAAARG